MGPLLSRWEKIFLWGNLAKLRLKLTDGEKIEFVS